MRSKVRPLRVADVEPVTWLAQRAYADLAHRIGDERGGPEPWTATATDTVVGTRKAAAGVLRHVLAHDSDGSLVAEVDGQAVGAAVSFNREGLWVLPLLAVVPGSQGQGIGRSLLSGLRDYLDAAARAIVPGSRDPAGVGLFFRMGFDIHPAMRAEGAVDHSATPVLPNVRPGTAADRELCETVDRRLRGAGRGPDHELLVTSGTLLVAEKGPAYGYAYVRPDGSPLVIAATQTLISRELLWACLSRSPEGGIVIVDHLTGEQRWAFDVARSAGLVLRPSGPVLVRGMALPAPYLPHATLG